MAARDHAQSTGSAALRGAVTDIEHLSALLARVRAAGGPEPRLDGELDALVDHENEAWPPPYTREVLFLQQITPRLGLDVKAVSTATLDLMSERPWGGVAILYAEALLTALIANAASPATGSVQATDEP